MTAETRSAKLSAWMDDDAAYDDQVVANRMLDDADAMEDLLAFHAVGDLLRASDQGATALRPDFTARLMARVAVEPRFEPVLAEVSPGHRDVVTTSAAKSAVNDPVFRWKLVAGFASFSAVAVLGSAMLNSGQDASVQGAELAQAAPATHAVPTVSAAGGATVMIRDPHLDAMMAAHKQFGGSSALQGPSGFLRNATFDTTSR